MKKIIALCLSIIMLFSLCACGGGRSGSGCTICGKAATHTFQGSGYCDRHYSDAVSWAIDNVAGK